MPLGGGLQWQGGCFVMAGRHRTKRSRQSLEAKARDRARVAGLGAGAGAFLALGLSPLAAAPSAKADVFDDILDLTVGSAASSAVTAVNPTDFFDPSVLTGLLTDLSSPSGWDTLFSDLGSVSSTGLALPDTATAASDAGSPAAAADPRRHFGRVWSRTGLRASLARWWMPRSIPGRTRLIRRWWVILAG